MELDSHKFIGMSRDTHPINQKPELLWEAHNIRITNRDDSTLLAITNEKGNLNTGVTFNGQYLGHCVLGKYLVVFTVDDSNISYIYRVNNKEDGSILKIILFKKEGLLDLDYPIQTLGIQETELVQKVYWVDGKHQPRVINITKPELNDNYIASVQDYTYISYNDKFDPFSFVQKLKLQEEISITNNNEQGAFMPGVVQYAFTYFNKYGQESNIFYLSPMYNIAYPERGAEPNKVVAASFTLELENLDDFEYVRAYSIHRSSVNTTPSVKVIADIKVFESKVKFIDDGQQGYTVDPQMLLYIGGKEIIANTAESKDGTLFLGNITIKNSYPGNLYIKYEDGGAERIKDRIKRIQDVSTVFRQIPIKKSTSNNYYNYIPNISGENISSFKYGEWYRIGISVQDDMGIWSDPIYIQDITIDKKPFSNGNTLYLPNIKIVLPKDITKTLYDNNFRRVKGVVVFPSLTDKKVLAQGILCPTVFNIKHRQKNAPFSQASWFLRPFYHKDIDSSNYSNDDNIEKGAWAEFRHLYPLHSGKNRGAEIQGMSNLEFYLLNGKAKKEEELPDSYFVDQSILTFHSPDIEFGDLRMLEQWDVKMRLVGIANFTSNIGDIDIQTSTPAITGSGFYHKQLGSINRDSDAIRSLLSGLFYRDGVVYKKYENEDEEPTYEGFGEYPFLVYPWQGTSLNNDVKRQSDKGTRTSLLQKKVISNLKFSEYNSWFDECYNLDITNLQVFNQQDTVQLLKLEVPENAYMHSINYFGNVDSITWKEWPNHYIGDVKSFTSALSDAKEANPEGLDPADVVESWTDPIRIKYKSSPHIVTSLNYSENGSQTILPSINNKNLNKISSAPFWSLNDKYSIDEYYSVRQVILFSNIDISDDIVHQYVTEDFNVGEYILCYKEDTGYGYLYKATNEANDITTWERQILNEEDVGKIYKGKRFQEVYIFEVRYDGQQYLPFLNQHIQLSQIYSINQDNITLESGPNYPYLFLAEIYRDSSDVQLPFGGISEQALQENSWITAGESYIIDPEQNCEVIISQGDTWYQRYDCLKTYPFTKEDENQLVEIGSFMCETRVNLDGRYDRNRGELSNINMSPQNFNLVNEVYKQKNNFFSYTILPEDFYKQSNFLSQITWTKEKSPGEDIDTWTNITLANVLNLNGSSGKVTSINAFNENLIAFQEQGISLINFNSRVQIPTSDGVPIEIQNSYKVDGYTTYSNTIGCQDKWSICKSLDGIYFIDNHSNSLYKISGQAPEEVSSKLGMRQWFIDNKPGYLWNPKYKDVTKLNGIRTFYDKNNNDIYLVPGSDYYEERDSLVYSLKLQQFTSLMSYGGTPAMFNLDSKFYSLKKDGEGILTLWENFAGEYNNFYGVYKPFDITFISNANATYNKIFDTLEYRADIYDSSNNLLHDKSFTTIQVSNEYQDTEEHRFINKELRKKFRVWRAIIPRDNRKGKRTRISNPWTKIKLKYDTEDNNKMVLHDMIVKYTV